MLRQLLMHIHFLISIIMAIPANEETFITVLLPNQDGEEEDEDSVETILNELLEDERRRQGSFYESLRIICIVTTLLATSFALTVSPEEQFERYHFRH